MKTIAPLPGTSYRRVGRPAQLVADLGLSGTLGAAILFVILLALVLGPVIWTLDPNAQNITNKLVGVSAAHPLGTDHLGRDLLARTLRGGVTSLQIGLISVFIGVVCGLSLGITGAVLGGWVEAVFMRFIDALLAIPGIVQALILVSILGRGIWPLVLALGIYSTPVFARVAHQATRQILQLDYIAAARALGSGRLRMVLSHIVPNLASPIVTLASFRVGANLLTGAALNFFGLGAQPPAMEWGLMVAEGQSYSWQSPQVIMVPGLALVMTAMGLNLLGDGLRSWLDPRNRS